MGFYTREEIEKVRGMDLLSYLRQFEPENLVKLYGNTYCTREHDSLKISNGKWMWFSQGFGGVSALDYLMKVKGCTFNQAMEILEGRDESPSIFVPRSRRKKLLLPNKSDSCNQIKAYLMSRGIDEEILDQLIAQGLIYEAKAKGSCIFIGLDDKGVPRAAAYRACCDERIMGEAAGSDKSWPFRIECKGSKALHLFESAIDLLSYATLKKIEGLSWNDEHLVSLGGVNVSHNGRIPVAIKRFLCKNKEITDIWIHFDSDGPGRSAAKSLQKTMKSSYKVYNQPPPLGKDYNDFLIRYGGEIAWRKTK